MNSSSSKSSSSLHRSLSSHLQRLQLRKDDSSSQDHSDKREGKREMKCIYLFSYWHVSFSLKDKKTLRKPSHKSSPPLPRMTINDTTTDNGSIKTTSSISSSNGHNGTQPMATPVSPTISKSSAGSFLSRTLSSKHTRAQSSSRNRPSPPPPSSTSSPLLHRTSDPLETHMEVDTTNRSSKSDSSSSSIPSPSSSGNNNNNSSNSNSNNTNTTSSNKARDRNTLKDVFGKFVGSFNGKIWS